MGCSPSKLKLDEEEAVHLCRDRRNFIKEAVKQRHRFALSHINYIHSLRRVSLTLLNYVEGNEHHDFFSDHYSTPPFTPEKRMSPDITGALKSFKLTPDQHVTSTTCITNCLRSHGNPSIPIEQWPESPETVRVESFYPSNHYDIDGFFASEASEWNPSFSASSFNRPSYPPVSPQNSQWDYFWNPFSTLDQYGYQVSNSHDEETVRLSNIRKEEGIPELEKVEEDKDDDDVHDDIEEEEEEEKDDKNVENEKCGMTDTKVGNFKDDPKTTTTPVSVENSSADCKTEREMVHELKECRSQGVESTEVSEAQNAVLEAATGNSGSEETVDFTVYVNRRPTSMVEVMKDVENQFARESDSAKEISVMLEANRAQYSGSIEHAVGTLNPVALFRSTSSRSSSFRFFQPPTTSKDDDDDDETTTNYSEECCMKSGSHQSTLDRLYSWEKKLYDEVKCGERIRIAYEKKCMQLRSHDMNGAEPYVVDKTRAAIRDLRTQLKVSIHSVESVSRRIESLRDEELYPQLMELIQGLSRMWRTMADCHKIQKRTLDEAKLLLFSSSSSIPTTSTSSTIMTPKAIKDAANLLAELRNWRFYVLAWTGAQRAYANALAGWASRCTQPQHESEGQMVTRTDSIALPIFDACLDWSKLVDSVSEASVTGGIDFLASGVGSVSTQQKERAAVSEGLAMAPEKSMTEVRERVICAGMSKVTGSLAEYAASLAEGYEALVRKFEEGRVVE